MGAYILAIRMQPCFDWGFWISKFFSVILFYASIFIGTITLVNLFHKGFSDLVLTWRFKILAFSSLGIFLSFCLAFSSPFGFIFCFLYILCIYFMFLILPSKSEESTSDSSYSSDEVSIPSDKTKFKSE